MQLRKRILELCRQHPKGISEKVTTKDQPHIDTRKLMEVLQWLLGEGKIDLLRQGTTLIYRLKTTLAAPASKTKEFEKEEKLVYQIIEDSGNKGIWIRDIRIKSNLPNMLINKTLKTVESKQLIKVSSWSLHPSGVSTCCMT